MTWSLCMLPVPTQEYSSCEMIWLSNISKLTVVAPVIVVCCWFVCLFGFFTMTGTYFAHDKEPTRYFESNQPLQ